ncbi:MAG: hypothetical protein LKE64_01660 [Solobacterium sp.]|jgi:type II secretory pathway component PulF|nr:hypothetical protein [Solobacterium sp.]MCH4049854.1 hypothetical protein [Solobacterium sp.]MCH4073539.1 hypothetical protein [Solobacterium sp.]MCI1312910.1 hypothetical protein [Solobacterium sp.]MCI1347186.1 hypothetical protein [Solobacterium sp.]
MKRKQKRICLTDEACTDLLMLLNSGFSFQESMDLLEEEGKQQVWQKIRRHLINGEEAGRFMGKYLPSDKAFYFTCFASFLPFRESLKVTMDIVRKRKAAADAIRKALFYPLTLLSAAISGVFLFDRTILPNMMSLMKTFSVKTGSQMILPYIFEICSIILIVLCVLGTGGAAVFLSKKRIVDTYRYLAVKLPDCLLVQYASLDFARIFCECSGVSLSTRSSIAIMKKLKDRPLIPFIASEMEKSFLMGEAMKDAVQSPYIEKKLARFFHLAIYAGDTENMLKGYQEMSQKRTERRIKILTSAIQLTAYTWIGIMLVIVYQVLMMPLGMLRQIG